jgi:hypothetical protein
MGNMLDHIGYSRDIWIDFAEGAFDLMRKLADSLQLMDGAAADILLQTFNDVNESMSIITYVKVRNHACCWSRHQLTCAATGERLGADARRRLPALCAHGRRQDLLRQPHRAYSVRG